MILFAFISISVLVFLGLKRGLIKDSFALHILVALYAVSLMPSLQIPYIIDDTDHLFLLSRAIESSHVTQWLFTPHNEHVIPTIKFLYYLCYQNFWLFAEPFHLVVILICAGILYATYALILNLSHSRLAAFMGASLVAATNLLDLAAFVTTNSHIIFCLFFFLVLFYAQSRYHSLKKPKWGGLAFLSILILPTTFSLGLTSVLYVFLFYWLCMIPKRNPLREKSFWVLALAWGIGLIPYLLSLNKILFAKEYRFVSATSTFEAAKFLAAAKYLVQYTCQDLIPGLLSNVFLSLGLFLAVGAIAFKYRRDVEWKKVGFFAFFGASIMLIIATFRIAWGPASLSCSRYNVFPAVTLSIIYALMCAPFFIDKRNAPLIKKYAVYGYLCCFLFVSYPGALRYQKAQKVAQETGFWVQIFNIEMRKAFTQYIRDLPDGQKLSLQNYYVFLPHAPSLTTKKNFNPYLTRYVRDLAFYTQYVLPKDVRERIVWGEKTDEAFLRYMSRHQAEYLRFGLPADFFNQSKP